MVFKASPKAGKIKVALNGADQKLVIQCLGSEAKPWRLTVPVDRRSDQEAYDPTYHKTAYEAYKAGVRDVWDLKL